MQGSVEFVEDDDTALDPQPPARPRRRAHRALRAGAVALALAAVLAWVVTRPSPSPGTPPRHVAVRPVPSILDTEPTTVQLRCQVGGTPDADVTAAMRHYLHRVTIQTVLGRRCVRTTGTRHRLVSEAVTGTVRGYDIQVNLSAPTAAFPPVLPRDRVLELGRVETEAAGVRVQVIATGYRGGHPPMARLQKLADYLSLNTAL